MSNRLGDMGLCLHDVSRNPGRAGDHSGNGRKRQFRPEAFKLSVNGVLYTRLHIITTDKIPHEANTMSIANKST